MTVGIPVGHHSADRRVGLVPALVPSLIKAGLEILVERGAGESAGFPDADYERHGARLAADRTELFSSADVILQLQGLGPGEDSLRPGQILLGLLNPLGAVEAVPVLARKGVTAFALELLPRISRAQPMDALTSMATIAGYKAALLAADSLPKLFPMMITAAATITPARVLVVGAGVAGLQAIATCRRLGAVVEAYDVRPDVKRQVETLGARFLELELETGDAEGEGGYARVMDEEFYRRQRELMTRAVAESDVVITTAAVPGKEAPLLITEAAVKRMQTGSLIIDLAAESGGNCALTRVGETVEAYGVTILGPANLAATIPHHASQMFAGNAAAFLHNLMENGKMRLNLADPIIRDTLLTHEGEVVSARVREILGMPEASASREEGGNA